MKRMMLGLLLLAVGFGGQTVKAEVYERDILELVDLAGYIPNELWDGGEHWDLEFNLDTEFSSIESVSMIWSGRFKGTKRYTFPTGIQDVRLFAILDSDLQENTVEICGGASSYPSPESFDLETSFTLADGESWDWLLDGQGTILIETYDYGDIIIVEPADDLRPDWGWVYFDSLVLQVEGTPVPEPAMLLLSLMGGVLLRKHRR